ncbi:right-handed parallel beta-helix repeat-containing protein [Sphingomonas koreensis]|nr:right-handed parallel beta-helix repeat-containing protein [Sphingomonas koreensis]
MRLVLALLAASIATPAIAQEGGPFTVDGRSFAQLQDAVSSIRLGTATIVIAPGVYHQCAVQQGGHITFQAAEPGKAIFDGTACEGKAALVLRGEGSTVDGLVFRNMAVSDGNGAGVRTESGNLTVKNSMFLDSQEGILGGEPGNQQIVIDHSTFSGLGTCDAAYDCAHSIYLENQGQVTVTHSRFERGQGGHYVKVRTARVAITDNSFDDSHGHKTNYMIDMSNGGTGLIARNTFVQGKDKENWTGFIVVAAEGKKFSSDGLRIEGNTASLAPGIDRSPAFVADLSGDSISVTGNTLGKGVRRFEER